MKSGGVEGPFSAAMNRFYKGQVIPLVAGAFGETNKDFNEIIKILAKEAAATDDGLTISPLVNTDRKGGAVAIMSQQFRRAIGVAIVRGQAKHKISRLHYVRATRREAMDTCRSNHGNNRWNAAQGGGGTWYAQFTPEGYGTFEQFRNGFGYGVF